MKTTLLAKDVEKCDFVVLFGTQLGNAGSIAESIIETGKSSLYNWTTLLYSLNQVKQITELAQVRCPIVIITSTTGDGEPPENADRFWRQIHKKTLPSTSLSSIKYTLLGLGDTNFNNFCNCGKQFHKRFQELGANFFYPPGWADDAVGIEQVVEGWIDGLWTALEETIVSSGSGDYLKKPIPSAIENKMESKSNLTGAGDAGSGDTGTPVPVVLTLPACPAITLCLDYPENSTPLDLDLCNPPSPYPLSGGPILTAEILSARYLTKEGAVKTTFELTLNTEEPIDFEPGDAIGIVCPNSYAEVDLLVKRLKVTDMADKCVILGPKPGIVKVKFPAHIPSTKTTLRTILTNYCDIRIAPKKNFVRFLAENTSNTEEKNTLLNLCSKEGSHKYDETVRSAGLSLLDILLQFPSCQPPVEGLLENLPRLIPRAYSISSSPLQSSTSFTIALNTIDIPKLDGRQYSRLGVCSGWLYELATNIITESRQAALNDADTPLKCLPPVADDTIQNKILFYKRKNHNFRLPSNLKAPVIMVGPGTGVAPFIGFLQHRQLQKERGDEIGELFLYFGCRRKERDFLYQETLENLKSDGIITQLNVSFSRDQLENNLKYVQDFMVLNQESVVKTLLDDEGYFYVCGDANNMAKNVREKLVSSIQNVKGLSEKEALGHIANLVVSKRYLQDIWA